jgi:hypothetical protein
VGAFALDMYNCIESSGMKLFHLRVRYDQDQAVGTCLAIYYNISSARIMFSFQVQVYCVTIPVEHTAFYDLRFVAFPR